MESVRCRFTPIEQDYTRTSTAFSLRQRAIQFRLVLLGGLLALFGLVMSSGIVTSLRSGCTDCVVVFAGYLAACGAFVGIYVAATMVLPVLRVRHIFRTQDRLSSEVAWQMDDDWIQITSEHFDSKVDWGTFSHAVEVKDHYLLVLQLNKRTFQFIPKRAFEGPDHEAAFRHLVERHLGPVKK